MKTSDWLIVGVFPVMVLVLLLYTDWTARRERRWFNERAETERSAQEAANRVVLDRLNGFLTRFEEAIKHGARR